MMLKGWLDLGPVSAEPALQSHGIGSALILAGNTLYCRRFGFALDAAACPADQPPKYFMTRCFGALRPSGPMAPHRLFNRPP